jgi:hypothetical protein
MSIITQDSKIITNLGGEIYKQSDALIDISSSYGVTKDGSNLVSKIKFINNPCEAFMQETAANKPIENGNGVVFDGSNDELTSHKNKTLSDFTLEVAFNKNSAKSTGCLLTFAPNKATNWVAHNGTVLLYFLDNTRLGIYHTDGSTPTLLWTITYSPNTMQTVKIIRMGNSASAYLDGVLVTTRSVTGKAFIMYGVGLGFADIRRLSTDYFMGSLFSLLIK